MVLLKGRLLVTNTVYKQNKFFICQAVKELEYIHIEIKHEFGLSDITGFFIQISDSPTSYFGSSGAY